MVTHAPSQNWSRKAAGCVLVGTLLTGAAGYPDVAPAAPAERLSQTPDCLVVENVHSDDGRVKSIGILDTRLHLYIYVPSGTARFSLGIYDQDDDSPAAMPSRFTLYAPDGKPALVLDEPRDNAWSDYTIETNGRAGVWRLSVSGPRDLSAKARDKKAGDNGDGKARNYFMVRTRGPVDLYLKPEPVMRVRGLRLAAPHFGGATAHAFTVQRPALSPVRFNFLWPLSMTAPPQWQAPGEGLVQAASADQSQWTGLKERDDRLARDLTLKFLQAGLPAPRAGLGRLTVPEVQGTYGLGTEQELRLFFNDAPLMPLPRSVPVHVQDETGAPLAARIEVTSDETANEAARAYSDGTGRARLDLLPGIAYRLHVARGFEFVPQDITVAAADKTVTVTLKRAVPRWPGWYCGDDHVHTLYYDGTHTPRQVAEAARAAGLDWLTMSEHGHSESIERVERANAEAMTMNDTGRFLVLPGMEYTGPLFHANILGGILHLPEKSDLSTVIAAAQAADTAESPVVVKLNHPSLGKTAADEARRLKALPLIELWNSNEPGATELWWELLNKGEHTYAETSSDSHHRENRPPGTNRTFIYLGDQPFTAPNIIRALREGRSFLSRGALLDFTLNGARPGATVPNGPISIGLAAESASPIESIEIVRNGTVVQHIDTAGGSRYSGKVALPAGAGWYLARVMGKGDKVPLALGNPVWVQE